MDVELHTTRDRQSPGSWTSGKLSAEFTFYKKSEKGSWAQSKLGHSVFSCWHLIINKNSWKSNDHSVCNNASLPEEYEMISSEADAGYGFSMLPEIQKQQSKMLSNMICFWRQPCIKQAVGLETFMGIPHNQNSSGFLCEGDGSKKCFCSNKAVSVIGYVCISA